VSGGEAEPYRRLAELVERQAALITAGDWEGFPALEAELRAIVAALPACPPAGVAELLLQAERRLQANAGAIVGAMHRSRRQLGEIARGRRAAAGYAPPAAARYLDLRG
jgi:hypothetical protein